MPSPPLGMADVPAASPRSYARGSGSAPASSVDFGRIFPGLPPFADANDTVRAALLEVGSVHEVADQLQIGHGNTFIPLDDLRNRSIVYQWLLAQGGRK